MNHRSLAFRLTAWYALLLSATFALVATGMFFGMRRYLSANLRDSVQRRSIQVEQLLEQAPPGISDSAISEAIETRIAPEFNNRFVRVTRAPARLVYRSGPPADRSFDPADILPRAPHWPPKSQVISIGSSSGKIMISLTPIQTDSGQYLVEVGYSLAPVSAVEERLLRLLALLLPVLIAFAAGGGYLLVHWALRPVERLSQTAQLISIQDPEARLPVLPTGDALQRLSISLNHMLGRLRDSMYASRRFLADASHELRTPLTVIKGELQEIVSAGDCPDSVSERVGSVLEEVARLEHLVSGLLVLSRLDAGEARREWIDVSLGELAANTADQMRLLAEDRGIELHASAAPSVIVRGDRSRLKQVIVNLLDNAIKFTPRGGVVDLRAELRDGRAVLEVRDSGVGIPAEALTRVFDRFYRVDEARSREDGGAGLGLSIVRSICSAHGAEIEVDSTPGLGSCFRLRFLPVRPAA